MKTFFLRFFIATKERTPTVKVSKETQKFEKFISVKNIETVTQKIIKESNLKLLVVFEF